MEKGIIMYRPKKGRKITTRPQLLVDQKSYNLKQLHKTLCDQSIPDQILMAQRASAAQLLKNQQRQNSRKLLSKSKQSKQKRDSSVNFYINIEKLRNLKIAHCQKKLFNPASSYLKKTGLSYDRKSALLKNCNENNKKYGMNSSNQSAQKSLGRLSQYKRNQKGKIRYKTYGDQSNEILKTSSSQYAVSNIQKRPNFKKSNESVIKDKTFIQGYIRGKQLGRGGFSKVWEGFNFKSKLFYAIKQIDTRNKYQTHLTQIWFGNYFFQNGFPKKQFINHPGIHNLLVMYSYSIVDPRAFIVYQCCQGSLGNMLYDIYQEDRDDQVDEDSKLYMIKYKPLYIELRRSTDFLKSLIYQIAQALDLLAKNKIVHSDIKTQNILVKSADPNHHYSFKLIDYGSSFIFESLKQYKLATPEYMCPQLLNYILYENRKPCHQYMLQYIRKYENISAIDVWGLGCIILEIIHGLPLWLSNRTKIFINGKFETKKGLFAVDDRSFSKILERQLYIVDNFDYFIAKQNNSLIVIDQQLKNLLLKMLNPNPMYRIKPCQIIQQLSKKNSTTQ